MVPDIHKLCTDLDNNTRLFLDILDTVPPGKLQQTSEQTAWCIMDCAEHVLIYEQQVVKVLQGTSSPVKDRAPNSKVNDISHSFLEFDKRLQVQGDPDTLQGGFKNIADFSKAFRQNREEIKAVLQQEPIDQVCNDMEHPVFGFLTRIEWAYYLIYHTERHLQQINRIEASLENMG
ncbi:DinB family protein [uncultured Chitinophaga sp.]|jgi:hypothetical protein|uniref:DinB family protein n=1 Tax=uncultured Chitinophaga sp. TaxID=339340 RepID=UPI0026059948|nr:DinB family protein [uncultured Chitinophaga sp.]